MKGKKSTYLRNINSTFKPWNQLKHDVACKTLCERKTAMAMSCGEICSVRTFLLSGRTPFASVHTTNSISLNHMLLS